MTAETTPADLLAEKEREIHEHPANRAHRRIENVRRVFEVWRDFTASFDHVLAECETDEKVMIALMRQSKNPRDRETVERELDKSLLAYVAGLVAVVDQSRPVVDLLPQNLIDEAKERLDNLKAAVPGALFLAKLRNYVLHYLSAPWSFHVELVPEPMRGEVGLAREQLLEWPDWPQGARAFLESSEDRIRMRPLIRSHFDAQFEYISWLVAAAFDAQAGQRAVLNALVAERNLILTGGVSDGSDWSDRMDHVQDNIRRQRDGEPQTTYEEWRARRGGAAANSTSGSNGSPTDAQ